MWQIIGIKSDIKYVYKAHASHPYTYFLLVLEQNPNLKEKEKLKKS